MKRLFAVFLLAGCTNTTDPILSEEYCLESHTETYMTTMVMSNGRGGTTVIPQVQTRTVCDKAMFIESPNPDYRPPA